MADLVIIGHASDDGLRLATAYAAAFAEEWPSLSFEIRQHPVAAPGKVIVMIDRPSEDAELRAWIAAMEGKSDG